MDVNWGLITQNGGSFIDNWNRGMATAGALEAQQRARDAARQQQQAQAQARGMLAQGRDLDAARIYAGNGMAEEANALRQIFQQATERATTANGAMANIVNVVGRLPYEQRRDAIRQAAPFLMQMGIQPEQIAGFDPTDTNVAALSRMFYTHEMGEDDNRQSFEANTGRISAEASQFNALHPQVDGTLLEYGPDGQARVVYRRERFNAAPVDSDVYIEPGVAPSPANRMPVQGQAQPQGQPSAFNSGRLPVNGMPQQFAPQPPQYAAPEAPEPPLPTDAPQPALAQGELYVPGGEDWGRPEATAEAPQREVQLGNLTAPASWVQSPQEAASGEWPEDRGGEPARQQPREQRQPVAVPFARAGFGVSNAQQIQNTLYDEYRQLGWTHEGALTMVAQVGRENAYSPNIIFGTHRDPNPSVRTPNAGMVSWNEARYHAFMRAMSEQGFVRDGRFVVSEESLRAQARYSDQEMQRSYAASARAVRDPNLRYGDIEPVLSNNYYGWDRNGRAVLGAAGARRGLDRMAAYYQTAANGFGEEGASEYQQANAPAGAPAPASPALASTRVATGVPQAVTAFASTASQPAPTSSQPAPQGDSGMGYRRVTQGRQRPARPEAAPGSYRYLTAEELRAEGYDPGSVVQRGPRGDRVLQRPPRPTNRRTQPGQDGRDQMVADSMRRVTETAQSLLRHPGFSSAVGFPNPLRGNLGPLGMVPGTDAYNFRAEVETLKNQQFLPMVQALRGMGALSNAEGARLEQSIASLDLGQGESQFRSNLNRILSDLSRYAPVPVRTVREARQLPQGTYVRLPNGSVRRVN